MMQQALSSFFLYNKYANSYLTYGGDGYGTEAYDPFLD